MIRWTARGSSGRTVIGLGIEARNLERLMEGKPIMVDGAQLGVSVDVAIHYGATKADLIQSLRDAGIELPPEKGWKR